MRTGRRTLSPGIRDAGSHARESRNSDGLCDSSWAPEVHDSARGAANLNDVRLLTFRVRLLFLPLCSDSLIIFRTYFFGPFFLSRKILAASILAQCSSSNQQSLNSAAAPSSSSWELVVNLLLMQFTEFILCSSRNLAAPSLFHYSSVNLRDLVSFLPTLTSKFI